MFIKTDGPWQTLPGSVPLESLMKTNNNISVVIPVREEMKLSFHRKIIESYKKFPNCELLWVIGPNNDGTYEDLVENQQRVIQTNSNSRAERINIGIKASRHSLILVNHPRSFLSASAIKHLSCMKVEDNNKFWGGFTHEFYQAKHPILKFASFYSNTIRFGLRGIIYLDHCIFFTKNLITAEDPAPVPLAEIFEDTLFSRKLSKLMRPVRIKNKSYTSPVRFKNNGVIKQSLMNQKLKLKFLFGFSKEKMNKEYEKDLNLNSRYQCSETSKHHR